MKKRIATGIIGGTFIALVTYLGGIFYNFIYLGITVIAIYEINNAISENKSIYFQIINYAFAFSLFIIATLGCNKIINVILFIYISLNIIIFILNKYYNLDILAINIFIGLYIVFFMYHMILLNESKFVWLTYIIAFGTDTAAYFIGILFGKHRLCPEISPKKTIEGAIGGIIGCTIISLIYFNYFIGIKKYFIVIIFSILVSICSMLGDLTASKIKREFHIKDYGNILPGHGGILDRFDSLLFIAPIVYYFTYYFI